MLRAQYLTGKTAALAKFALSAQELAQMGVGASNQSVQKRLDFKPGGWGISAGRDPFEMAGHQEMALEAHRLQSAPTRVYPGGDPRGAGMAQAKTQMLAHQPFADTRASAKPGTVNQRAPAAPPAQNTGMTQMMHEGTQAGIRPLANRSSNTARTQVPLGGPVSQVRRIPSPTGFPGIRR